MSPTGEEGLVPVQVYSCGNCGKVPKSLLEGSGIEESVWPHKTNHKRTEHSVLGQSYWIR